MFSNKIQKKSKNELQTNITMTAEFLFEMSMNVKFEFQVSEFERDTSS